MQIAFLEAPDFTDVVEEYFGTDDHYRRLQQHLAINPGKGTVIPGTGHIRKVRWADPRRGQGKSFGLRVLYIYVPEVNYIVMLDVYDKGEADDLSPHQKVLLKKIAEATRRDVLALR